MAGVTLGTESTIWLFGREFSELEHRDAKDDGKKGKIPKVAQIYAFAFHNEFFELDAPTLFLLDKVGKDVTKNVADIGVAVLPEFAGGLTVWQVDLDDVSTRLDMVSGRFSRILIDMELTEEGLQDFVRGSNGLGLPSSLGPSTRRRRRRWQSDED